MTNKSTKGLEKYIPTIDTPEEEKELKKIWGIKEKDPYKIKTDKKYRDIKYLGNWEKTSDNTPHYDIYLNKIKKIEKERINKEKQEIEQKDKTKIELRNDIKQIINNIILKNKEDKPDLIVKDFKLIPHKYPKYFTNITKTSLYTKCKQKIKINHKI